MLQQERRCPSLSSRSWTAQLLSNTSDKHITFSSWKSDHVCMWMKPRTASPSKGEAAMLDSHQKTPLVSSAQTEKRSSLSRENMHNFQPSSEQQKTLGAFSAATPFSVCSLPVQTHIHRMTAAPTAQFCREKRDQTRWNTGGFQGEKW